MPNIQTNCSLANQNTHDTPTYIVTHANQAGMNYDLRR